MATAQESGPGVLRSAVGSAREFAGERLREANKPMSPSELADEYDCSAGHMRNVLREMRRDGEVSRPEKGRYQCPPGQDVEVDPDGVAGDSADSDGGADGSEASDGEDVPSSRDAAIAGAMTAGGAAAPTMIEEMDTKQILAVVGVVVAVYLVFFRGSGSSSENSAPAGANREEERRDGFGVFDSAGGD